MLPEVSTEHQNLDPLIRTGLLLQKSHAVIGTTVIDKNQFIGKSARLQGVLKAIQQLRQIVTLIAERQNHTDIDRTILVLLMPSHTIISDVVENFVSRIHCFAHLVCAYCSRNRGVLNQC